MKKLEACWSSLLRNMVKGGWKRKDPEGDDEVNFSLVYSNERVKEIIQAEPLRGYIDAQYLKYIGHVCRSNNCSLTKTMLFAKSDGSRFPDPWIKISRLLGVSDIQAKVLTQKRCEFAALIHRRTRALPQRPAR